MSKLTQAAINPTNVIPPLMLFQDGEAIATGTVGHSEAQLNELLQQAN